MYSYALLSIVYIYSISLSSTVHRTWGLGKVASLMAIEVGAHSARERQVGARIPPVLSMVYASC